MARFRQSITMKLFAAMLAVAAVIIIFVAVTLTINMRAGFARYMSLAELAVFDQLHDDLVAVHQPGGWPQFEGNDAAWSEFMLAAVPQPPRSLGPQDGNRPPPKRQDGNRRPKRRNGDRPSKQQSGKRRTLLTIDPMRFGSRLQLLNNQGQRVAGAGLRRPILAKRPIIPRSSEPNDLPLGWIALTADGSQTSGSDYLFLQDQLMSLAATLLLALMLSGIAAYFLAKQFLKPVRELALAGDQLSSGNYSIRLTNTRSDELGALLSQFNQLAENLDKRDKIERKWISDTSHELKTPLAVLRAQIEAIQDGVHAPDPNRLEELHTSTMRLSRLVADLNSLSNLREGHLVTDLKSEDINQIINSRLENSLEHLTGKQLSVESNLQPALLVECDRLRIGQLLDNLLQNAARYTTVPGTIRVIARSVGEDVEIRVEDSPPCPPKEAREKMFDRFFREEESRNRRFGGSGLGLSICREIVSAHGGTISLSQSDLGGLCVTVILPKKASEHE